MGEWEPHRRHLRMALILPMRYLPTLSRNIPVGLLSSHGNDAVQDYVPGKGGIALLKRANGDLHIYQMHGIIGTDRS